MSAYLHEHLREILGVIGDTVGVPTPPEVTWESTFWTRCRDDAVELREKLFAEVVENYSTLRTGTVEATLVRGRNPRPPDPGRRSDDTWGIRIRWSPSESVDARRGRSDRRTGQMENSS
jgi:hypothetical protein